MGETVRMKDIAQALGISVVTVSNALSGKKGVSDEVRRKIRDKARELGYNSAKYSEERPVSTTIGVIVAGRYIRVGISFYWMMYQQIVYAASGRSCFTMLEVVEEEAEKNRELPKIGYEGNVSGLIIIGQMDTEYIRKIRDSLNMPVILMDFNCRELECDSILSNNYMGMYKMTRYLLERGHRDIGYIGQIDGNDNLCDRYFGYRKGLAEQGIAVNPDWVVAGRRVVYREFDLSVLPSMPTAFVCCSDLVAGFVYDELSRLGYRVPEDISLVGYDNYLHNHPLAKILTTYNVDMKAMSQAAIRVLLKKIGGKEEYCGVRYLDSFVKERGSVKTL